MMLQQLLALLLAPGALAQPPPPGPGPPPQQGTPSPAPAAATSICARDGSDYSYQETVSGNTRTIVFNGCPNHPWYQLNPNYPIRQSTTYNVPAYPKFVGTSTSSSTGSANIDLSAMGGGVGVLFNGALLFSPYGGPNYGTVTSFTKSATYAEGNTFDQCGCHGSSTTAVSYHCHVPPPCLLKQLGQAASSGTTSGAHSPQVGWATDGFPVYGPHGPGGVMMQTCTVTGGTYGTDVCTDDCGGYYRNDGSIDQYVYRYYMQGTYNDGTCCNNPGCPSPGAAYHPHTPVCYRGCCPTGASCQSGIPSCGNTAVDGYRTGFTPAVPTINQLSVGSGLPQNTGGCACGSTTTASCSDQAWASSTINTLAQQTCPSPLPSPSPSPSPSPLQSPTPPSPSIAPSPTPSPVSSATTSFDCARYTAQCVDTSVTPQYADCAATVAANPSGMTCRIEHLGRITDGDSATQTQHCPHAQETATGPCASENPLASSSPSPTPAPLQSPTPLPSPVSSTPSFDCARYTAQCVDTSVTPQYADCAATVAANPSGMTCRIEHLGLITDGDSASQTQHCPHAQETATGPCASENPLASAVTSPTPSPLQSPAPSPLLSPSPMLCSEAATYYMESKCCGQPAKMLSSGVTCLAHRRAYQSSNCCSNPAGQFAVSR
eukprot:TRINITY_DN10182_c0_g1_i4.p1 TRINITY_DN10182_c0_g1~~TRINITY_DN10182_c0_g1_i4.p1  ORF type:complete len:660 (+),score=51.41 TRINITY_DN10182_c0_g1_i4:99-2078(+)